VDGYKAITTQIFDKDTPYLDNDSKCRSQSVRLSLADTSTGVFAVKDGLTIEFKERKGDPKAPWELEYNVSMAPMDRNGAGNVPLAPAGSF